MAGVGIDDLDINSVVLRTLVLVLDLGGLILVLISVPAVDPKE